MTRTDLIGALLFVALVAALSATDLPDWLVKTIASRAEGFR